MLDLQPVRSKLRQLRGYWKDWAHRQTESLRIYDPEGADKKKKKIIAQFPYHFSYQDLDKNLLQIKKHLKKIGVDMNKPKQELSFLKKQLDLSCSIWKEIMLEGKILPLTREGICWEANLEIK